MNESHQQALRCISRYLHGLCWSCLAANFLTDPGVYSDVNVVRTILALAAIAAALINLQLLRLYRALS